MFPVGRVVGWVFFVVYCIIVELFYRIYYFQQLVVLLEQLRILKAGDLVFVAFNANFLSPCQFINGTGVIARDRL